MRFKGALFVSALVGAAALTVLPAAGARADASAPLAQLGYFHQMVLDQTAGYIFFSEGVTSDQLLNGAPAGSAVVVTDLSGTYVTTLDAGDEVEGLALSSDGTTLYAALDTGDAVGVISTASLTQTATYPLPASVVQPYGLAIESGKLWVSYNGRLAGSGAIGDIDLSAAAPAFEPQAAMGQWYSAPDIASDPSDTGVLAAAEPGGSPVEAVTYSVAADPAALLARGLQQQYEDCVDDGVAVYPGGREFLVCNSTYSTSTMRMEAGASSAGSYPDANTISPNGSLVALADTGQGGDVSVGQVDVYPSGSGTPLNEFSLGGGQFPEGVAFSSDDARLYVVTDDEGLGYSLHIIDNPAVTRATLALGGPSSPVLVGHAVTITGDLQSYLNAPAGSRITITRTEAGSTAAPEEFTATTGADGTFTLTDAPATSGTYTYAASYPGTATIDPAAATLAVVVTSVGSTLKLTAPTTVVAGLGFTLTGTLDFGTGPAPAWTPVTVTRTEASNGASLAFTADTAAGGLLTWGDVPEATGTYTYSASYAGGADVAPSNPAVVTVKVVQVGSRLTLSAPPTAFPGSGYTITGRLTLSQQTGITTTGSPITINRSAAGVPTVQFTATTDANGNFTLADKPAIDGTYTYAAAYAGTETYAPSSASATVRVARAQPALTVAASASSIGYGGAVTVTAHLGRTQANRTLSIYAQTLGRPAVKLLTTGRVNAQGDLTVRYAATHSTTFRASFSGDADYGPAAATRSVTVAVKISMVGSGYFTTENEYGLRYHVYHHTARVKTAVTVAPNKSGQCAKLEVQQYDPRGGDWHSAQTSGCHPLGKSSQVAADLTPKDTIGGLFRLRAEYVRGAADTSNSDADGAWFYFKVVK